MDEENHSLPKAFLDAWIHLSPLQKKIIFWRVLLESIRARAFRFIQSLTDKE